MITEGSIVRLTDGRAGTLGRFIGEGGQGVVHEVTIVGEKEPRALKWYFDTTGTPAQRESIAFLVERGAPDERFLWPDSIATAEGQQSFGYVMDLRPDRFVGLADLLTGKIDMNFTKICTMCIELTSSFLALHNDGLCYRDISFGNVFFDPRDGSPLICDNDNVGIEGASTSAVLGTRRFMAPEIVRGESMPTSRTDLFSLAVLLFYILMVGHPLVGRRELEFPCWDERAEFEMFGRHPVFIFHPHDRSNAAVPEHHEAVLQYWPMYPLRVHRLFARAFTEGLDPSGDSRVRESEWRVALAALRDSVRHCQSCGCEAFWTPERGDRPCWNCGNESAPPIVLELNGYRLVLNAGTLVTGHHLRSDYRYDDVLAEVVASPTDPTVWGLRNHSDRVWSAWFPDGQTHKIACGQALSLVPDAEVMIGDTPGRLVVS